MRLHHRFTVLVVAFVAALSMIATPSLAAGDGQKKTVHVKEYTKKDGTTVKAHDRKAPDDKPSTKADKEPAVAPTSHSPRSTAAAARDEHGHILRSAAAKHAFAVQTGYPKGRPGYVVDHIRPLACGGADDTSNMQWQTVAEAKMKDKWERAGCR